MIKQCFCHKFYQTVAKVEGNYKKNIFFLFLNLLLQKTNTFADWKCVLFQSTNIFYLPFEVADLNFVERANVRVVKYQIYLFKDDTFVHIVGKRRKGRYWICPAEF